MAANMHVERGGAGSQQVIVDGGYLEPALDHLEHDRIDFGFEEHEVAHHHGLSLNRLERDPAAERQRRLDGDAVERHGEIGARKTVAVHVARYRAVSCRTRRRLSASPFPARSRPRRTRPPRSKP